MPKEKQYVNFDSKVIQKDDVTQVEKANCIAFSSLFICHMNPLEFRLPHSQLMITDVNLTIFRITLQTITN
jgi:hypothetical protein